MGDFKPSTELRSRLPQEVLLGIENHRFVDKKTDQFQSVKDVKRQFSSKRRRFAGVITDIAFDYFLIKYWNQYTDIEFGVFTQLCYDHLDRCQKIMPPRMQFVTSNISKYRWLNTYASLEGVSNTIDKVSERIRFKNEMVGGIEEIESNYDLLEQVFLELFDYLVSEVSNAAIEQSDRSIIEPNKGAKVID